MSSESIHELVNLRKRLANNEPVAGEALAVIRKFIDSPDPAALHDLEETLQVALKYQKWAVNLAKSTDPGYKKNTPGAWIIDGLPHYAEKIISGLKSAIEKCTPAGQPVVYESADGIQNPTVNNKNAATKKKWWNFFK
jgi:hypothetical protein